MNIEALSGAVTHGATEDVRRAAELLEQGLPVVVPTETVYGIAVNLSHAGSRDAACRLKNIERLVPWVIHIAAPDQLREYVREAPMAALAIVQRGWPGPIALRLRHSEEDQKKLEEKLGAVADEVSDGGWYTLRCPDAALTRNLLKAVPSPMAIVGAAKGGFSAASVADLAPEIAQEAAMVLDAGPVRYRKPSTVVQVEGEKVKVIRAGVLDERVILRMTQRMILFVCSGNTCRSPMAAAIAQHLLEERRKANPGFGDGVTVQSAGLHANLGMPATLEGVQAARELGATVKNHGSQPVTIELLRRADVVYTMTQGQREELLERFPAGRQKVLCLDPEADIDDPIGGDMELYRQVARRLTQLIDANVIAKLDRMGP